MKSIGEVAARFGLPTHVLRHWEAEGLLAPARDGDCRRYTDADQRRVAAILLSKDTGLALADIRAVLDTRSAPVRHEVIARQREKLLARIARARAALDLLEGGERCAHDDITARGRHLAAFQYSFTAAQVLAPAVSRCSRSRCGCRGRCWGWRAPSRSWRSVRWRAGCLGTRSSTPDRNSPGWRSSAT